MPCYTKNLGSASSFIEFLSVCKNQYDYWLPLEGCRLKNYVNFFSNKKTFLKVKGFRDICLSKYCVFF